MQLLAQGLGQILRILGLKRKTRLAPLERERRNFEEDVRRELIKLKDKGISLPVFTL